MSAALEHVVASLDRREQPDRRREGVRRQADLDGWARVLAEGITEAAG